jgi:hypothetical protein
MPNTLECTIIYVEQLLPYDYAHYSLGNNACFLPSHMVGYSSWPRGDPLGIGEVIVRREPCSKGMCKNKMLLMPMSNLNFRKAKSIIFK